MTKTKFEETDYRLAYQAVGVCLSANIPVILWGDPGQGKTQVILRFAALLGRHPETIIASLREPQDFLGLPALHGDSMDYFPPTWAKSLSTMDPGGIIFFDEISTAPPSVQAALLRVCLEKVVGDVKLPADTRIIAAANPPGIAADGWDLAAPLANRFCHIAWSLPTSVVAKGFQGAWPNYEIPPIDPDTFEADFREELSLVGEFLIRSETPKIKMTTVIPSALDQQGGAFPTPRSWEMAARASAAVTHLRLEESLRKLLLTGCVGEAVAKEYFRYRNEIDLPDPEAILADPYMQIDLRPDIAHRTGHAVLRAYDTKPTEDRWKQVSKFIVRIFDDGKPDVAYSLHRHYIKRASSWPVLPDLAKRISEFTKN